MPMKLSRILLIICVTLIAARGLAAQNCTRHVEPQGGFSICIPDGWTAQDSQNEKFKMLFGPRVDGFTPNTNFRDEVSTAPLSTYVAAGIKNILASTEKLGATSIELLGQSDFTTDSGMRGTRAVFQTLFKGAVIRTIQYYFDAGNGRKLIVTGTSLDKNKEVFDRFFDRNTKTFRLE